MKSKFLSDLDIGLKPTSEGIWVLDSPLSYYSELLGCVVMAQSRFNTDLASVPRIPIVHSWWGGMAHREAVIHDYLFCIDSIPVVPFQIANKVFLEAMESRGKSFFIRHPMYMGVCAFGKPSYHKRLTGASL